MDPTAYIALIQLLVKSGEATFKLAAEGYYKIKAGQDLGLAGMIAIHDSALKGDAASDIVDAERRVAA
jgi:hypothetical protein